MLHAMGRVVAGIVSVVALVSPGVHAEANGPHASVMGSHVRGATPAIARLVEHGIRRSPTFAALVAALNRSDVIVYIDITPQLPAGIDGRLAFATSAGGVRYLHAQVAVGLGRDRTIAVAGHELQHALEVADDPRVRDRDGLAVLYAVIGIPGARRDTYDTAAAQQAGRRVRSELS